MILEELCIQVHSSSSQRPATVAISLRAEAFIIQTVLNKSGLANDMQAVSQYSMQGQRSFPSSGTQQLQQGHFALSSYMSTT
jgi:hypothetical protein